MSKLIVAATIALVAACGPKMGASQQFIVTISLDTTNVSLAQLVVTMQYSQGELCGTGSSVQCTDNGLDSGVFDDQEDNDGNGTFVLDATLQKSGIGMQANDDIFKCTVVSPITPAAGNFTFTVVSALDTSAQNVSAADLQAISLDVRSSQGTSGSCQAGSSTTSTLATTTTTTTTTISSTTTTAISATTTTTSSTTTTTASTSTTTVTNGPTTTTTLGAASFTFDVTYEFLFPMTTIGALQFNSDYSAAGGDFDGTAAAVACAKEAGFGALEAFNDNDAGKSLSQGFVDSSGFTAARVLSTCRFLDADGLAPAPADFVNSTTDCSDLTSMTVSCFTGVKSVTACSCGDGTVNCVSETCDAGPASATQTCGDGIVNCSGCTSEQCDDGNTVDNGNGCSGTCQDNHVCGNTLVESLFEQCDDGGVCQASSNAGTACTLPNGSECVGGFCQTQSGDGCDSNCLLEP